MILVETCYDSGHLVHYDYSTITNTVLVRSEWKYIDTNVLIHPNHILLSIANFYNCATSAFVYIYHFNGHEHYTDSYCNAFSYSKKSVVFVIPIFNLPMYVPNHVDLKEMFTTISKDFTLKSLERYAVELLSHNICIPWAYKVLHLSSKSEKRYISIMERYLKERELIMESEFDTYIAHNEFYNYIEVPDAEWAQYEPYICSCNINIMVSSNAAKDTISMFRMANCSVVIPYIEVQHHHSTATLKRIHMFHDIEFPSKLLEIQPIQDPAFDGILFLFMSRKNPLLVTVKSTLDKKINSYVDNEYMVKYVPVTYNTLTKTFTFKYQSIYGSPYNVISYEICKQFGYLSSDCIVTYNNCMQKKVVPNKYIYPNVLKYMFDYLPEFENLRKYIYVDESKQTALMGNKTKVRLQLNNSRISVSIESKVADKQTNKLGTKIYSGWSYTVISFYRIYNKELYLFADAMIYTVLDAYHKYVDYVCELLDMSMTNIYAGNEHLIKDVPDIIQDIKQEVPELWVPNTSKQVNSSSLIILKNKEVAERHSEEMGVGIMQYPDPRDPIIGKYSRWYSSTNKNTPHMGLIINTKNNSDLFKFLPNTYVNSHLDGTHHYSLYLKDPLNYTGQGTQETTQLMYHKDSSARKNEGMSQCPKFIQNILHEIPVETYRMSYGKGFDRFAETMINIFGHYDPMKIVPYMYMCRQEFPNYSDEYIAKLFLEGYNPMYFIRAIETYYGMNIMVITVRDKRYKLFPHVTTRQYLWEPIPNKPFVILLCFIKSRKKYIYECIGYKQYDSSETFNHFWYNEYNTITRFIKENLMADTAKLPSTGTITGQYIRADGIVTAVQIDNQYWLAAKSNPLHVEYIDLTSDMLPTYEFVEHIGIPRGYVNIKDESIAIAIESDNGDLYLIKPTPVEFISDERLLQTFYPDTSLVDGYANAKKTTLLRRDILVSMMLSIKDPSKVTKLIEYTDNPKVYSDIVKFVTNFKYRFDTEQEAIEYYNKLSIKLQFKPTEKKAIESLIQQVYNNEHVSYSLSIDYLFMHSPLINVLCFSDQNKYLAWKTFRSDKLRIIDTLKKEKVDYVFECIINDNREQFEVICSVLGNEDYIIKYFESQGRIISADKRNITKVSNEKELITVLKHTRDFNELNIMFKHRKDWYCPLVYVGTHV